MDFEFVECNYCGSEKSNLFVRGSDFATTENEDAKFRFNTCARCGLIYQNPRPTSNSIQRYYPETYSPYNKKGSYLTLFNRIFNYEKKCVLDFLQTGQLLDVGCASGHFLHEMQKGDQFNLTGVEFSPFASQKAREEFGLNVFTGDLLTANFQDEQYDVVTLWNVLEHVYDPVGTVKEVYRVLKPGGYFIVRVPNPESFAAKIFGKYWAGLDLPRHLFLFSRNVLISMAEGTGFSLQKTYFWGYMWPTSIKFWFNGRKLARNGATKLTDQFIYRLSQIAAVRLLLYPFWEIVNWMGLGENMTLAFKKQ